MRMQNADAVYWFGVKYEISSLKEKISRGFDLLGGVARFFKKEDRVLLKPNLLTGDSVDKAITTHPVFFQGVAEFFLDHGLKLVAGDSPGLGTPQKVAEKAGIADVCRFLNIPFRGFDEKKYFSFPKGRKVKSFELTKELDQVDKIVSLPKIKSHGMAVFTGGLKNCFGLVPGKSKVLWHNRMPDINDFSEMIVDLIDLVKPDFCISDAIVCQEGNGPRSGAPFKGESLIMSPSLFLADLIALTMMGFSDKERIPIVSHYGKRRSLSFDLEDYLVLGDDIKIFKEFDRGKAKRDFSFFPKEMRKWARKFMAPFPVINNELCVKCGVCYETCPTKPKSIVWDPSIFPYYQYENCIRCFCCQEMCPKGAIALKYPLLAKILVR